MLSYVSGEKDKVLSIVSYPIPPPGFKQCTYSIDSRLGTMLRLTFPFICATTKILQSCQIATTRVAYQVYILVTGSHRQGAGDTMVQVSVGDIPHNPGCVAKQCQAGGAVCHDSCQGFPVLPGVQAHDRVPQIVRHPEESPQQPEQVGHALQINFCRASCPWITGGLYCQLIIHLSSPYMISTIFSFCCSPAGTSTGIKGSDLIWQTLRPCSFSRTPVLSSSG